MLDRYVLALMGRAGAARVAHEALPHAGGEAYRDGDHEPGEWLLDADGRRDGWSQVESRCELWGHVASRPQNRRGACASTPVVAAKNVKRNARARSFS